MSIPVYVRVALLSEGLFMEDGRPPNLSEDEFCFSDSKGGYDFIDNESQIIYSPRLDKNIKLEEIKVSKDGFLEEELLILNSVTGISPECDNHKHSVSNWMDEGDYIDMLGDEANMMAFYEIAKNNYKFELEQSQGFHNYGSRYCQGGWSKDIGPIKSSWHESKIFNCSFIGLFYPHTSQGFEDLYPELDYIEFLGEGRVELIKNE